MADYEIVPNLDPRSRYGSSVNVGSGHSLVEKPSSAGKPSSQGNGLQHQASLPQSPVPMDEATRQQWKKNEEESRKSWLIPVDLGIGVGFLLIFLEAVAVAILTWLYVGSDKGLTLVLADSPKIVGLHWDPFIAVGLSVIAGIAWCYLFAVPVLGPLAGLAASAVWGIALYAGTGSLVFGVLVFAVSLLARMVMRKTRRRWLSVAEWGFVVVAAVVVLAPFGAKAPIPGFGGWQALLQVYDTQACDKELRAGSWKGRDTANPAFFAARKSCVSERARR